MAGILTCALLAMSQGRVQSLVVAGGAGNAPVVQLKGRNYVELEALARAANGSLSFSGNQVTLSLAGSDHSVAADHSGSSRSADNAFSSDFLRAGIEAVSSLREWHSALASAIGNGYPVTSEGFVPYQTQATRDLRLAQVAATTDADQKAAQLLANGFEKMKQLSDKYVTHRTNMNYVATDALQNDPADQALIACGRAIGAMAASGQFSDDASCH
jgi:hypothetical protein